MIGSETDRGRVVSRFAEDSDPLLAFSTEPGVDPPVASPSDPQPNPLVRQKMRGVWLEPRDPLIARVDRLERALEDSKKQVSTLKSEVATLVRA